MDVIVDVVDAEAMIASAAGAITELQPGVVGIRTPTDRALVVVELIALFLTDLPRSFAEIDGGGSGLLWEIPQQGSGEENHEVENRDNRKQIDGEGIGNHREDKICSINERQILHPDRNNEKQKNLLVGKQGSIGEEHGEVKILRIDPDSPATDEVHQKTVDDSQKPPDQQINIKLRRAPILLERAAHPVIEIEHKKGEQTGAGWIEHEGEKAPDLPAQYQRSVKAQIAHQNGIRRPENPENNIGDRQIPHEIRDAEIGMPITETVDQTHGIFHRDTPPT